MLFISSPGEAARTLGARPFRRKGSRLNSGDGSGRLAGMRLASAAILLALSAALAGCITTSEKAPQKVQTTSDAEHEDLKGAVAAPLRDLNLMRTKIPPVLLEAMSDPYYRPPEALTCADILIMLTPLKDALGADIDEPEQDDRGLVEKGRGVTLGAVASASSQALPFRGWVRKLSGAERHDKLVQDAIIAGAVRRGYLKGLGEARGCPPPMTPSHKLTTDPRPTPDQSVRVRYPTKRPPAPGTPAGTPPADPPR